MAEAVEIAEEVEMVETGEVETVIEVEEEVQAHLEDLKEVAEVESLEIKLYRIKKIQNGN